jgi:hypothetical protein
MIIFLALFADLVFHEHNPAVDILWTPWKQRTVSINYLLRVVLDFNSVMFMFYFNWMRVNDYCIL